MFCIVKQNKRNKVQNGKIQYIAFYEHSLIELKCFNSEHGYDLFMSVVKSRVAILHRMYMPSELFPQG